MYTLYNCDVSSHHPPYSCDELRSLLHNPPGVDALTGPVKTEQVPPVAGDDPISATNGRCEVRYEGVVSVYSDLHRWWSDGPERCGRRGWRLGGWDGVFTVEVGEVAEQLLQLSGYFYGRRLTCGGPVAWWRWWWCFHQCRDFSLVGGGGTLGNCPHTGGFGPPGLLNRQDLFRRSLLYAPLPHCLELAVGRRFGGIQECG